MALAGLALLVLARPQVDLGSSKRLVAEQKKLEPIQDKLAKQQEKFQSNLERIAELERQRPFAVGQTSKNIKQSAESLAKAKAKVSDIDQELKKLKASNRGLKPEIDKNTAAFNRQVLSSIESANGSGFKKDC